MSSDVREARDNEAEAICHSLAQAFEDDPVSSYLYPDAGTRVARLRRVYRVLVPELTRHGALYCDASLCCGAVWQAPSPPPLGSMAQLAFGLRTLLTLGASLRRARVLAETLQASHLREPHWYLGLLGTRPDRQGEGVGSRVLAPILARCDRDGTLGYLESSKQSNIPFYQRHGFEVSEEIHVPDGPTLWAMTRAPRPT